MNISTEMHNSNRNTILYSDIDVEKINSTYLEQHRASSEEINADTPVGMVKYINTDTNTSYCLNYDQQNNKYFYDTLNIDDEKENLEISNIKLATLAYIPENRLLFALNPFNHVSLKNRYIKTIAIEDGIKIVIHTYFDDVGLVDNVLEETSSSLIKNITYSYDYVQDHFTENIISPIEDEDYKNQIVYTN